jgi:hypothetical protein
MSLFLGSPVVGAESAQEILEKSRDAYVLESAEYVVSFKPYPGGENKIHVRTKRYGGSIKTLWQFIFPPGVRNCGVLVHDHRSGEDDVWWHLRFLPRTTKIEGKRLSHSFMDSVFTFYDLSFPEIDDFDITRLEDDTIHDDMCYVIRWKPKTEELREALGYTERVSYIGKSDYVERKSKYFQAGKETRIIEASDIAQTDDEKKQYRAMSIKVTDTEEGRDSSLKIHRISNKDLDDKYFSYEFLVGQIED